MALPAPILGAQPADILRLVATSVPRSDQVALARSGRVMQPVQGFLRETHSRLLRQQKLQWGKLLSGILSNDYAQNEQWLRSLGVHTLELTASEEEAWEAAWVSLASPPSALSSERKTEILTTSLPEHCRLLETKIPVANPDYLGPVTDGATSEVAAAVRARAELIDFATTSNTNDYAWSEPEGMPALRRYQPTNLTQLALWEAPFETVLRIFTEDGNRYTRRRGNEIFPAGNAALRETPLLAYANQRLGSKSELDSRDALLALLVASGQPINDYVSFSPLPVMAQILSISGYDFLLEDPRNQPMDEGWGYLRICIDVGLSGSIDMEKKFRSRMRCLEIILDRLLVQGQLSEEVERKLEQFPQIFYSDPDVFDRIGDVDSLKARLQGRLRAYLEDRRAELK